MGRGRVVLTSRRTTRRALLGGGALGLAALAGCSADDPPSAVPSPGPGPTPSDTPTPTPTATATAAETPTASSPPDPQVAGEVATGLAVAWGMAFLPDGSALVGERDTGRVLRVSPGSAEPVGRITVRSRVDEAGESGLLGLALHPEFATNGWVYAYASVGEGNRVVRMSYDAARARLGEPEVVLDGIAASVHHNGGALLFADGLLHVATGDAERPDAAPDPGALEGKVLRVTDTGAAPPGATSRVWTRGHRNVEGLALDERGRVWASEFGDKGADELNLLRGGRDYGWPEVEGDSGGRFADPFAQWPVEECSPAGLAITRGRAWLGALRGECLWSVELEGPDAGRTRRHLAGEFGRIRAVVAAPDGSLWVGTSNRDGRTDPGPGDDRILHVAL
ncbi:PQQ-dependent sugar dehydrogenase [Nocardioides flavescens]|uniref:PQQ-dependent sugar dehydrogenase n=1 Tax=Nocardioides flavescens TaxID=2691959 RepID=UPI00301BF243